MGTSRNLMISVGWDGKSTSEEVLGSIPMKKSEQTRKLRRLVIGEDYEERSRRKPCANITAWYWALRLMRLDQ